MCNVAPRSPSAAARRRVNSASGTSGPPAITAKDRAGVSGRVPLCALRSRSITRRVSAISICGCLAMSRSKAERWRETSSLSRSARTRALRGSPVTMAISPTISPRRISPTTFSPPAELRTEACNRPFTRMYACSPGSPCSKSVVPRGRATHATLASVTGGATQSRDDIFRDLDARLAELSQVADDVYARWATGLAR